MFAILPVQIEIESANRSHNKDRERQPQVSELGDRDHHRHDGGREQYMFDVEPVLEIADPVLNNLRPAVALGLAIDVVDVDRVSDVFRDLFRVSFFGSNDRRIEWLEFVLVVVGGRLRRGIELIAFAFVHGSQELRVESQEPDCNLYFHCGMVCV